MDVEEIRDWIKENFSNDWFNSENFKRGIAPNIPKELKVIQPPPPEDKNYNCFIFAFGLEKDEDFLISHSGKYIPLCHGNDIKRLILNDILISAETPRKGDYIIYSKDNEITHAGIVKNKDLIVSKWSLGPIMEHQIRAVNPEYGEDISYYKKATPQIIKDFFKSKEKLN